MSKTILITGATDGIGKATAQQLVSLGHTVLLHGRNGAKLEAVEDELLALGGQVETYIADLASVADVLSLVEGVTRWHETLDVIINNAGVLNTASPIAPNGLDVRFMVNAIAPYLLTQRLLPLMNPTSRVVNVSSAAQSPVNLDALTGQTQIHQDFNAYAQSKLAITMWSRVLALKSGSPVVVAVNPGSMLGSKMVKEAFGVPGGDLQVGADILVRAAIAEEFATASGQYFDNDAGLFAPPHPDALNVQRCDGVVEAIEGILAQLV